MRFKWMNGTEFDAGGKGAKAMNILRRLLMVLAALVLLGAVCAAGLIGFVYYKETHLPPVGEFDTIIVLGAQVKADGTPSVALERRLTAALEEYRKQPRLMIVCGAQGSDEPRAEGDVMRDWLIAQRQRARADGGADRHQRLPRAARAGAVRAGRHHRQR